LQLRADDHRAEFQQLEVSAVLADTGLPIEDRPAVLELDRECADSEQRARDDEADPGDCDIECAIHGSKRIAHAAVE
jgi:hypothetical protein